MVTIFQRPPKQKPSRLQPRKIRLPRSQRAGAALLPGFRLTRRDIAVVDAVYRYRALTTPLVEQLLFSPSTRSRCRLRLKYLYHHGYLRRAEQPQTLTEGRKPF